MLNPNESALFLVKEFFMSCLTGYFTDDSDYKVTNQPLISDLRKDKIIFTDKAITVRYFSRFLKYSL